MRTVTKEMVEAALRQVIDPELGINVMDLGLVYGVEVGKTVHITMTLTTVGCPLGSWFEEQVKATVAGATQLTSDQVSVTFTFDPPWTRDMMNEEALAELGLE